MHLANWVIHILNSICHLCFIFSVHTSTLVSHGSVLWIRSDLRTLPVFTLLPVTPHNLHKYYDVPSNIKFPTSLTMSWGKRMLCYQPQIFIPFFRNIIWRNISHLWYHESRFFLSYSNMLKLFKFAIPKI